MAITEDDRLALRNALAGTIGERETRVLMESLPPMDYDQIATKSDLETQRMLLSSDIRELRTDMNAELSAVRTDMNAQFSAVDAQFAQVNARFTAVDAQFAMLRGDIDSKLASQLRITVLTHVGSMIGLAGLVVALT
ncbi:MAG: hypothetical protein IH940_10955 [Acidobacteria bacterium]|nr:hypothetical protein [Acidobacteriota bacterium]